MKKIRIIAGLLICLGLSFAFSSCNDNADEGGNNLKTEGLEIGKTIEMELGETFENPELGLSLRVENIGDSRCPVGANCIWEGNAAVEFQLITKNENYTFTLDTHSPPGFNNETVIEGFKYQLLDVLPYPVEGEEQPTKRVKILVDFETGAPCDQDVIIDKEEFENAPSDPFDVERYEIVGNCLKIKFSAGGCDGNSWVVKLIDLGTVAESLPCQRTLRLSLDNTEECAAYITKEISFNIEDLQIAGNNCVQLNIFGDWILYEY